MKILAVSLDLDDTLWPIEPAIVRAEQRLDDWLRTHCPSVAEQHTIESMRALRDEVAREHPHLSHDFTTQRMITLRRALAPHGFGETHVADAFEAYFSARNEIECYADALPALAALAERLPLVSISNGNADLARIGLADYFQHSVSSREFGIAKPDPEIFHHACERLGLAPENVLHVGDDPLLDVVGARSAGLRTAWLNRSGAPWSHDAAPDIEIAHLGALIDWLDAHVEPTPLATR